MKFKHLLFTFVLTVVTGISVNAQTDQENCEKYRSLYYEYLRQGMNRDAMNFWQMAYNYCGGFDGVDSKLLANGRIGYIKLMDAEQDSTKRAVLRDSVYWIYEGLIKKEPANADWKGRYGSMMVAEEDKRHEKIDSLLGDYVHTMKSESSPYNIHQYFKHLIINKFNGAPADKKDAVRDMIIDEYMLLSDYVSDGAAKNRAAGQEDEAKRFESEQDFMDKYFLMIVKDCETLTTVVERKISALPQNKDEKSTKVKSYIDLLDKKKCQATPTYGKLMDTLITIDPTAEAYYITGKFYSSQDQDSKAVDYFEKAVQLEDSVALKNKYMYELAAAQQKLGRYKAAFNTAKGVEGEYRGKAMMICGNAIAATANDCGDSTFDRKANFWLANDYYRKAAALGEDASTSKFLDRAPTVDEGFTANKREGEQVFLNCWGESTTIRY